MQHSPILLILDTPLHHVFNLIFKQGIIDVVVLELRAPLLGYELAEFNHFNG